MAIDRIILGPMPEMVAKLVMGPDEVAPYLTDDECCYPSDGEIANTWTCDGVQMVSAIPEELCRGSLEEALAYLAHEAVHCAKRHLETIGEREPAEEELAYHVGSAAYCLFTDFFDWLGA